MRLVTGIAAVALTITMVWAIWRLREPKYLTVPEWVYNPEVSPAPRRLPSLNVKELRRRVS